MRMGVILTLRTRLPDIIDPAVYFADARAALPTVIEQFRSPEYLQALNLISMTALETNDMTLLHQMFGLYHAALAVQ
jgi:hypothetical protein